MSCEESFLDPVILILFMDKDNNNPKDVPLRPEDSLRRAKIKYSRVKRKILRHVWLVRLAILLVIVVTFGAIIFGTEKFFENLGAGNIFTLAYNFISAPMDQVSSTNGHVNILLMGKAGGGRPGDNPDLTDTMILVSVGLNKPQITTISIPRDTWIPEIRGKINSSYYWGKQNTPYFKSPGGSYPGITFAKTISEEVVGQPIQYGVVVDFSAFKDIVDAIGGIQVDVQNTFTDKMYPIAGRENDTCGGDLTYSCRYETVTFNAGVQNMDGDTALKFVRSRHAEGIEGTDLAREARQQKVIDAIKNKIINGKIFLSLKVDLAMLDIFQKYVVTDIDLPTSAILARKAYQGYSNIHQYLIPDGLLVPPPIGAAYDQQYVFIPKAGNGSWGDINKWFSSVLN